MKLRVFALASGLLLAAALLGGWAQTGWAQTGEQTEKSSEESGKDFAEQGLLSVAWLQTSAEAEAIYYQGYDEGEEELNADLAQGSSENPAIVVDIDDTVLDDSPYQAYLIKSGEQFPKNYDEWIESAQAEAVPGAVSFLKYADSKGVDIYYVSGRKVSNLSPTVENLQRVGAPQATEQHVLLTKPDDEGKDSRFQSVAEDHQVLLYFGDHLGDFPNFGGKSLEERNAMAARQSEKFGDEYILFPNPMYGSWEGALYGSRENLTKAEKTELRKQSLDYFQPQSTGTETTDQDNGAATMPETGGPGLPVLGALGGAALLSSGILIVTRQNLRRQRGSGE